MPKPKITKTTYYRQAKAYQRKKSMSGLLSFIALCATTTGFVGIIHASYPKSAEERMYIDSALPVSKDDFDDSFDFYPPDAEVSADDYAPILPVNKDIPRPKSKPQWIKDNAEFNNQLEQALR